jgi:hypothetical protein
MELYKKILIIYSSVSLFLINTVSAMNSTVFSNTAFTIDVVNSTYTKDWLYYLIVTNKTSIWDFPLIGFTSSVMGPFADAFYGLGAVNLIYLILWGLFIMIACITAGAWSLLFPESAQPWVLILLAAALASQLMTFYAKE